MASKSKAIQAATVTAAKSIDLEDIGIIEERKFADLLILNENPLEDIRHTKGIHSIIKGGKQYYQEKILSNI